MRSNMTSISAIHDSSSTKSQLELNQSHSIASPSCNILTIALIREYLVTHGYQKSLNAFAQETLKIVKFKMNFIHFIGLGW